MDRCHMDTLILIEATIIESILPNSGSWDYIGVLHSGKLLPHPEVENRSTNASLLSWEAVTRAKPQI